MKRLVIGEKLGLINRVRRLGMNIREIGIANTIRFRVSTPTVETTTPPIEPTGGEEKEEEKVGKKEGKLEP